MIKALGSLAVPIPIAFGDAVFWGASDTDEPIRVCIERKKIGDLAQCIITGRYLHQAQSAKGAGMDVLCLIVEGPQIRSNPDDGLLDMLIWGINPRTLKHSQIWEQVKPAITYSRFDQYLTELEYLAGVIVKRSADVKETASIIKATWDNFQVPPSKHGSLKQIFSPPPPLVPLIKPSLVQRVACELDGIGWSRSLAVAAKFGTVKALVDADVKDWMEIDGIGKKIAEKVVAVLRGER